MDPFEMNFGELLGYYLWDRGVLDNPMDVGQADLLPRNHVKDAAWVATADQILGADSALEDDEITKLQEVRESKLDAATGVIVFIRRTSKGEMEQFVVYCSSAELLFDSMKAIRRWELVQKQSWKS